MGKQRSPAEAGAKVLGKRIPQEIEAAVAGQEKKAVYGRRQTGDWENIFTDGISVAEKDKEKLKEELEGVMLQTGRTYELHFQIPPKPWYAFWLWFHTFDPASFTNTLREQIADGLGISKEGVQVIWWQFNDEVEPAEYTVQIRVAPQAEVGFGLLGFAAVVIICGTVLGTTYLVTRSEVILKGIKGLAEAWGEAWAKFWEKALPVVKWGGGLTIAALIIYLIAKRTKGG